MHFNLMAAQSDVSSDLAADITVAVGDVKFHLHKAHPDLTKGERKQICGLMDVKKLTMDASMHAAQNDRLSLRVVVQVLYFEQVRTTASGTHHSASYNTSSSTPNEEKDEEEWDRTALETCKSLRKQMNKMKIQETRELHANRKMAQNSQNSRSGVIYSVHGQREYSTNCGEQERGEMERARALRQV